MTRSENDGHFEGSSAATAELDELVSAARGERAPPKLEERVLAHVAYRSRLEQLTARSKLVDGRLWLVLGGAALGVAASVTLLGLRPEHGEKLAIRAEHGTQPAASATAELGKAAASANSTAPRSRAADPCLARLKAPGSAPLIDDFEDGDDEVVPLEGRAGFWRWPREIDAPGSAPALMPVPRPQGTADNRLALHIKGGRLVDWGAAAEFDFRPPCYDASKYVGISFQARGPGRVYVAPREVGVIPVELGGTCERDCHNYHAAKVDLDGTFRTYRVRWVDVRQRGFDKPALDPTRLNSIAFLVRAEDTPYDVWFDDVRFISR